MRSKNLRDGCAWYVALLDRGASPQTGRSSCVMCEGRPANMPESESKPYHLNPGSMKQTPSQLAHSRDFRSRISDFQVSFRISNALQLFFIT